MPNFGFRPMPPVGRLPSPEPPIGRSPEPIEGGNPPRRVLGSFKEGGTVPKTGAYKLHEGEKVVPNQEHTPEEKRHFQRAMHKLHGGALHRHLGIPEGEPIPLEKKEEAAHSENKHVAAMGRMAVAMHGWSK